MGLFADFKKFAFKGNVVDLAVGVVIGGAFQKVVTGLVESFIMPVASLLTPDGNWRERAFVVRNGATAAEDVAIKYGAFLGVLLDFLLVAFVLFLIVSRILKTAEKRFHIIEPAEKPEVKECPFCLDTVPFKARRCKSCTSELEVVSGSKTDPTTTTTAAPA